MSPCVKWSPLSGEYKNTHTHTECYFWDVFLRVRGSNLELVPRDESEALFSAPVDFLQSSVSCAEFLCPSQQNSQNCFKAGSPDSLHNFEPVHSGSKTGESVPFGLLFLTVLNSPIVQSAPEASAANKSETISQTVGKQ